jgi:hypothetical protein
MAKKTEKTNVELQFGDKQISYDSLVASAKSVWENDMNRKLSEIKTLDLYVKPEESKAYFVVNGSDEGNFDI